MVVLGETLEAAAGVLPAEAQSEKPSILLGDFPDSVEGIVPGKVVFNSRGTEAWVHAAEGKAFIVNGRRITDINLWGPAVRGAASVDGHQTSEDGFRLTGRAVARLFRSEEAGSSSLTLVRGAEANGCLADPSGKEDSFLRFSGLIALSVVDHVL